MKYGVYLLAGSAALMMIGCRPELAREKFGDDDAEWSTRLKENYGGYQAPRTYAPALIDKYENFSADQPVKKADAVSDAAAEVPVTEEVTEETVKPAPKTAPKPAPEPVAVTAAPAPASAGEPVAGEIYTVQNGDTLGRIAQKFYKDAHRADLIFQVNRNVLKDANHVRPGMKLVIPPM